MQEQAPQSPTNQNMPSPETHVEISSSAHDIVAFLEHHGFLKENQNFIAKGISDVFYGAFYGARDEGKIHAGAEDNEEGLVALLGRVSSINRTKIAELLKDYVYVEDPVQKTDIQQQIRELLVTV